LVPLGGTGEEIDSQSDPLMTGTVQFIVPEPVFKTLKFVVPALCPTVTVEGLTLSWGAAGAAACTTVTSVGLPVAPGAVTRIVPVRCAPVFNVTVAVIVELLVEIDSQSDPFVTDAVQLIVPVPSLVTVKVVGPAV